MTENTTDKIHRGPLRALTRWLKRGGATVSDIAGDEAADRDADGERPDGIPSRIGHYVITAKLGAGGMGVVYSARDERLQRTVAIKTISSPLQSEEARLRFWREARAAASVNHPNICQIHEIGEDHGQLFLAMELLEGEPLDVRLRQGALSVPEAVPIGLGILAALGALHERGIVHRDLKPSNVFLTPHGVKLLDFGLARALSGGSDLEPALGSLTNLTGTGMVVGTPRYMAPEQVTGGVVDSRSDLFAAGAILFEMVAGRPPFAGRNVVEVLHATLHEQPPALTGPPAVAAIDRVIRRALAKRPEERPASAAAMVEELRAIHGAFGEDAARARALTRLVVLPFRVLRPDPETDFLAFSLPDAIATSLSGSASLVVRSSAAAARFADAPDLKALAAQVDVDRVVLGTLLRSGDQLQANVQLVEAPDGTILTSHTVLSPLGNLFQLQDDIARRVVDALSLPLSGRGSTPAPELPHDTRAYKLYLQANELSRRYEQLEAARDLYEACLELDPRFAPAWAQLARCHWVIAKYIDGSGDGAAAAETALRRALDLSPRLPIAHKYYANLESDTGHALQAMRRLLGEAKRHGNDPELFAGLVHSCRYAGLFEQAIAAHEEARRLDPNIRTSYEQTVLMTVDLERLLAIEPGPDGDGVIRVIGLGFAGRRDEARRRMLEVRERMSALAFGDWANFVIAWLDRRPAEMRATSTSLGHLKIDDDPEALFQSGWMYCDAGDFEIGLETLRRAIDKNYFAAMTLSRSASFDPVRNRPDFKELLAKAEVGREQALAVFREGGGELLLGR